MLCLNFSPIVEICRQIRQRIDKQNYMYLSKTKVKYPTNEINCILNFEIATQRQQFFNTKNESVLQRHNSTRAEGGGSQLRYTSIPPIIAFHTPMILVKKDGSFHKDLSFGKYSSYFHLSNENIHSAHKNKFLKQTQIPS